MYVGNPDRKRQDHNYLDYLLFIHGSKPFVSFVSQAVKPNMSKSNKYQ